MEFKKKILKNGLTILFEKRDVPVTTIMLAVKYGSAYETAEEKGMAHFIEHLSFKGTKKRNARDIASEVEKVGGELNAFTHEEITAYHVKLPSKHLGSAMDVIFDVFFNPTFPEEEVKREAGVICEEIKMYKDNPRTHVIESIKRNLYEEPFGDLISGSEENVLKMTRDDLMKKHDEVYVSGNSILCVVGNNDFDEIVRLVESMEIKKGNYGCDLPKIIKKTKSSEESREGIEQVNLAIGVHFPNATDEMKYAAEIFNVIFGEGMSSKLFVEVREKRGLAYAIRSEMDSGKDYGYMVICAGTESGKEDEVRKISLEEFHKMKDLTEEELRDAKIRVIGNRNVGSEDSSDTAINLIFEEVVSDADDYYKFEEKINSVTLGDIKKLAEICEYSFFSLGPN